MPLDWGNTNNNKVPHVNTIIQDINSPQLKEDSAELSLPIGRAKMSHWQFDGIRMIHSDWVYNDCKSMTWQADIDIVHLHFNLKGQFTVSPLEGHMPLHFAANTHNMLYTNMGASTMKNEELEASQFILQFTRDSFLQLTEHSDEALQRFADKVLSRKIGTLSPQSLPIDLSMQQNINSILRCNYQGGIKKMFLFSKAIEMLVLQAASYHQTHHHTNAVVRTPYDRERLHFVRDHLLENLENPPTLSALARMAGLNEYKLKYGFKELFNTTAFGFVAEQRLELARTYLRDQHKSVGEIATMLGYSSIQHFSTAFKKKFGCSPNKAR
ncbi:helix-turn-helix transcriptional regulator [Chitinophaga flava]|uniref:AraC family transcriptional regulator n=1 Tax=Chitinophaga flava TaxID=2259036 RepID=A0A365XXI5_9BACT|nr:AraC family transcriptional regulator [Chitinophaga flava]RBL91099.1 AraC family transcriptional regulator [Chitinophaga flava]